MFIINFANDCIRTADLWYQKQPLYQLSHNHCYIYLLLTALRNLSSIHFDILTFFVLELTATTMKVQLESKNRRIGLPIN